MRTAHTASLVAAMLALTTTACQETASTSLEPEMGPSLALVGGNGMGAMVAPSCQAPRGTIIETLVPISDTDWWVTLAEVVSSTCRTLPSGALVENFSIRVLSDVPLPETTHRGSLTEGNVFDIYVPGVGLVAGGIGLSCFYDGDPGETLPETLDADFVTTPSGISNNVCRFEAPDGL